MADNRKLYVVSLVGIEHTLLLTAEDAARYGAGAVEVKQSPAPTNKARSPQNKSDK